MNKLSSEPPGDQTVSGSASAHQLAPHDDYEDEIDDDDICDNYDDYDDCDMLCIPAHQPGPQHFLQVCTARFRIQIQNRFPSTPLNTLHFAGKRGSNRSRKDRASSTTLHGNVRPYDFWGQLSTCCTSCQLKHFIEGRNC